MIFEGEYLNGVKWNGKGKVYSEYNGKLIFEGEYLNGKRIRKEYDDISVSTDIDSVIQEDRLSNKKICKNM